MRHISRGTGHAHASAHRRSVPRLCCQWRDIHLHGIRCNGWWRRASTTSSIASRIRVSRSADIGQLKPAPVRSLRYVDEGTELRGTGGALRLALDERVLDESFFVLYGDSFLPVEVRAGVERLQSQRTVPRL